MGFDPRKIGYLKEAAGQGQTDEANVRQIGEPIETVRTRFQAIPEFRSIYLVNG
jgi:hypothetical protein